MTLVAKPFVYRESVQAYFESAEVRFPVDQLLTRKMKYVPQTFTGEEVSDFYKACLAARQTQIDYAQDMFDLWHCIWPDLGASWKPAPYDPADDELSLDPQIRWDEGYFQRSFDLGGKGLRASLWLFLSSSSPNGSEIELGCTLMQGARSLFKKGKVLDGWEWDKHNNGFEFSSDVAVSDNGLDLEPFVEAAQRAVGFIEDVARQ